MELNIKFWVGGNSCSVYRQNQGGPAVFPLCCITWNFINQIHHTNTGHRHCIYINITLSVEIWRIGRGETPKLLNQQSFYLRAVGKLREQRRILEEKRVCLEMKMRRLEAILDLLDTSTKARREQISYPARKLPEHLLREQLCRDIPALIAQTK